MNRSGNRNARDELGLPAVPPRAHATNPWRDRALAALFAAGIALPGLSMLGSGSRTAMQFENRPPAPWPAVSGYRIPPDFPGAFERAFADRFGGRDALIGFHHAATVVLLRRSPVQNVLVGRDGWLYYKGDDGRAFDRDFRRVTPPSAAETAVIAEGIARRVRFLKEMGVDYLLAVVPDKQTIYPEHVPPQLQPVSDVSPLDALLAALSPEIRAHVLDLRPALRDARRQQQVYWRTDSHWNRLGAWVGGTEIVAALRNDPTGGARPALPETRAEGVMAGDLARMIGVRQGFEEPEIMLVPAPGAQRCAHDAAGGRPAYGAPQQTLFCESAQFGTAAVFHDSMGIELLFALADHFRKSRWVSSRTWNLAELAELKPALVIDEVVERNLPLLADVAFLGSASRAASPVTRAREWRTGVPFHADALPAARTSCALDEVNAAQSNRVFAVSGKGGIDAQGWVADADDGAVPGEAFLVLGQGREAFHVPVATGLLRPDVASALGKPALATAGFRLAAPVDGLPPGIYPVTMVWRASDAWHRCDTQRAIDLRAGP
jgi:alginate O-acetyltransferase complex protein AlgJ